jgi:hypothetical protein
MMQDLIKCTLVKGLSVLASTCATRKLALVAASISVVFKRILLRRQTVSHCFQFVTTKLSSKLAVLWNMFCFAMSPNVTFFINCNGFTTNKTQYFTSSFNHKLIKIPLFFEYTTFRINVSLSSYTRHFELCGEK